ncbi:cysteine-rich small domain-containing protein [Blautia sp.]|uniref:cysteine-rich small domain-containing protein n=1 Tax=Blautia sp. TaxID=1955243 RepID=UPI003AAD4A7F
MREDEYSYKFFENRACEYFPCARYDIKNKGLNCLFCYCPMYSEYSCAMKSHFRKFGNQMSGSGNHLCNYASLLA